MTAQEKLEARLAILLAQEPDWKMVARWFESRLLEYHPSIWVPNKHEEPWIWSAEIIEILRYFDDWKKRYEYAIRRIESFENAEELLFALAPNFHSLE